MKKLKEMTANKKLTILAIVILSIFAVINIFWALSSGLPSYGYKSRLGKGAEASGTGYSKEVDGLVYNTTKPVYLSGRGYLHVYNKYKVDIGTNTDNGMLISLFIYPKLFGSYEYAVIISDDIQGIDEMASLDENLNYIPYNQDNTEENKKLEKLINENHDEIKRRMDAAQNMWKFDENDTLYGLKAFVKNIFDK